MTEKEYKRKILREKFRGWRYIFVWLRIPDVKVMGTDLYKRRYWIREFNPWNPLSYIIATPLAIMAIFMQGVPETIEQIKRAFRYK